MLKKILLIENNKFLGEILETNLQVYLNSRVERRESLKEALNFLSKQAPGLIITKEEIDESNIPLMVSKALEKKGVKIPMIILGDNQSKLDYAIPIDDPTNMKGILSTAAKILKVTAESMSKLTVSTYYPIHLELLVPSFVTNCNLYMSVGSSYEILISKGEKVTKKIIDDLKKSDIKDIYVNAFDRLEVVNSLTNFLIRSLKDDSLSLEERVSVTSRSFELVQDTVSKVGVDPHTAALAEASIISINEIVKNFPDLKSMMDKLSGEEHSFRYLHSILNTFIGFKIITQTRWGNKEQQDKFAFVSFFHDISLDTDEQAKISSQEDLEFLNLSPEESFKIENHALKSAKIVSKYKKLPFGVDTIIKQHHGSRDGKGFKTLSANISPLAIMFIFAEEWSTLALEAQEKNLKLDKNKIMEYLKQKYNIPKYKQFLPLLEKLDI